MKSPLALIIEDDPDLGEIFSNALKIGGFEIELIADGGQAIKRLQETLPDITLLDVHLPNMAGTSILQRIRSEPTLKDIKIILVTADARAADDLKDEADLVLIKPISFSQLRDLAKRFHTIADSK